MKDEMRNAECEVPNAEPILHPSANLLIGLDVGSTTVKAVVVDPAVDAVLWRAYQRHETRPYETCLGFLLKIERAFPEGARRSWRVFTTGTGGAAVGQYIGACPVQEVNAVCHTVSKRHPEAASVVELGGEDAKVVLFRKEPRTGVVKKWAWMNDKCAGGTGAVIDKVSAKLGIRPEQLGQIRYGGVSIHPVAGKCGVFAETDITGLQKQGVPSEALMASLFDAIVRQDLAGLAHGYTLRPVVLLLGGPHVFLPGLRECWRHHLARLWEDRRIPISKDRSPEELAYVPEDALFFAALGAVEFGKEEIDENPTAGVYQGVDRLRWYVDTGRFEQRRPGALGRGAWIGSPKLATDETELRLFREQYGAPRWTTRRYRAGSVMEVFLGVDAGSTSTKAAALDTGGNVIAKSYQLSRGNPIEDAKHVVASLDQQIREQGAEPRVLSVATTGYAKDLLKEVIGADLALVETVAHMRSGLHQHPDADVICDVGGQDIKILLLKNGVVTDFRLNTQCSAGNGYYLQATAAAFGYRVEDYADVAFAATAMPEFGCGCAVFLQSDIAGFQRQGWQPNEILAGLAAVLPKNIWLYVCQMPNLPRLGRTFVLQGGVQRNLAAVKAQVDFIQARFEGKRMAPEIVLHEHCGEAGAVGCALEVHRRFVEHPYRTSFIGFEALAGLRHRTRRDESTRCGFCTNRCLRTFIDVTKPNGRIHSVGTPKLERRIVIAHCEKGATDSQEPMRTIAGRGQATNVAYPNLAAVSAREVFEPVSVDRVADRLPELRWLSLRGRRHAIRRRRYLIRRRADVRIGIPRVLSLYSTAPFFLGYFGSLGVPQENVVWSDPTSNQVYREGRKFSGIDPCFPSKVAVAHVHNLLSQVCRGELLLTHIFFPEIDAVPTWLEGVQASRACPASVATPEAAYAACIQEGGVFAELGIRFKKTFVDLSDPERCARQMGEDWGGELGVRESESRRAVREGLQALEGYYASLRREARRVLTRLEQEGRIGIVLLARPYHNDPGVHHGICEEFQRRGYPVLTVDSLPIDDGVLGPLFAEEVAAGEVASPRGIEDVWKHSFSEHTSRKLWAAKFVARHPNLVAVELSSFKCGHDAPTYAVIEGILESAGKPHFSIRDLDENNPVTSIRLRIDTICHFLEHYRERIERRESEPSPVFVVRGQRLGEVVSAVSGLAVASSEDEDLSPMSAV